MSLARAIALLAMMVLGTDAASAQNFGAPLDRYFRLEWEVERGRVDSSRITGYVYNDRGLWALNVRLLVEAVDAAGRTISQVRGYVPGDVPPEGRVYFEVAVPSGGATYRVRVESFGWLIGPSG